MKIVLNNIRDKSYWLIIFSLFLVSLLPISFIKLEYANTAHVLRVLYIASIGILFLMSVRGNYKLNKNELWLIILIVVWGLSIIPTENKKNSIIYIAEFITKGYILVFIIPRLIQSVTTIKTILKWIIFLAGIVAFVGIIEVIGNYNIFLHSLYLKYNLNYLSTERAGMCGSIGHPLPFASYLVTCFSLTWYFYYFTEKKIYIMVAVLLSAAIFLSVSRSATLILVFLVIGMSIVYLNKIKKILLYTGLFFIFILAGAMIPKHRKIIAMRYAPEVLKQDITNSPRYYAYFTSYNILKDYPILGVGPGNTGSYLIHDKYRDPRLPAKHRKVWNVRDKVYLGWNLLDNMYLNILTGTGILGFGVFLLFLGNFFKNFWFAYKKFDEKNKKLLLSLGLCLVAFLLNILFYDGFDWFAPNLLFWCLWGLTQSLINISHSEINAQHIK